MDGPRAGESEESRRRQAAASGREQLVSTVPSVLVIDGDRGYRTLVDQELTAAGYQVLIVPDEQAGRRTLERGDVDVVVVVDPSSADLPDVDLLEAIRLASDAPIIVLSADARASVKVPAH